MRITDRRHLTNSYEAESRPDAPCFIEGGLRTRLTAFATVAAGGFLLQVATLAALTMTVDWPYVPATAVAVEVAVLHNFWWHERWTWSDRSLPVGSVRQRLLRYHLTTATTSIAGNLLLTAGFVELAHMPVVAANIAAVGAMAAANFFVADRWVFAR